MTACYRGGPVPLTGRVLLLSALAVALPAYLQTNPSFQPIDERLQLSGQTAEWPFRIASRESLFLEFALTTRAAGRERPTVAIGVNGTEAARLQADNLYVAEGGRLLLPVAAIRAGENRLTLSIDDQSSAFEFTARLQNYRGINPRFPRAFVVSDEAVALRAANRSAVARALTFTAFFLAALAIVSLLGRVGGGLMPGWGAALLLAPSAVLWGTLVYGLATPLHVWLPLETVGIVVLVPVLAVASALAMRAHRVAIVRFAGVAAVTFLALEGALRLFNAVSPSFVFYSDTYTRYRGRPGTSFLGFPVNSRGFYDVEHPLAKGTGLRTRVVALGDSFAFGVVPYDANYLTLLEQELGGSPQAEVVNMGIAAAEPQDYLAVLAREGLAYEPDVVLVSVFIGNDFEHADRPLHEYSYAATLGHFLIALWRASPPEGLPGTDAQSYVDDQPTFADDRYLEIAVDRAWVYDPVETRLGPAAERAMTYLRDMRNLSAGVGAAFVVVLIPDEVQVDRGLQEQVARARGWDGARVDFRRPNRLLAEALEAERIAVLDLLPAFEEAGTERRLYKPRDTHWNRAGNRLAAERIGAFLRDRVRR
jgi:hypothetical protein